MLWPRNRLIAVVLLLMLFIASGILITKQKSEPVVVQSSFRQASPEPSATPQEIKYDAGTDLKKELETVNPQVLESDFTESNL